MRRSDDGSATIEFVWMTILLLVPLVYVLVGVFDTQRASYGVSVASRSAARAFLQAPDAGVGEDRARRAAAVALDDQGLAPASVTIACLPSRSACLTPGSSVRVTVRTTQALPFLPDGLAGVAVDSTHTEPYGSFRGARS